MLILSCGKSCYHREVEPTIAKLAHVVRAAETFTEAQDPPRRPRDLQELLHPPVGQHPYLEATDLLDQWGKPIVMEMEERCDDGERSFRVLSMSEDGQRDKLDSALLTVGGRAFDPTCPVDCARQATPRKPFYQTELRLTALCEAIQSFTASQRPARLPTSLDELVHPPEGQAAYVSADTLRDEWDRPFAYTPRSRCMERYRFIDIDSAGKEGELRPPGRNYLRILVRVETEECASRLKPSP